MRKIMGRDPRIETANLSNFVTIRAREHEVWYTCDPWLEKTTLGEVAKCVERYGATLYAFGMEGTHKHELADFSGCNRAAFYRDLNAACTRAIKRRYPDHFPEAGALWARRYSQEFIVRDEDLEQQFFYTVLQPVLDGLVSSIYEYPGYNCFEDAIHEREREYTLVDWTHYNSDKRWKKNISIKDYEKVYKLKYTRLPQYKELSKSEYIKMMRRKLKERTKQIVEQFKREGKKFLGREKLLQVMPGSRAKNPKKSTRWQFKPRIICKCPETAKRTMKWYRSMVSEYVTSSHKYRAYLDDDEKDGLPPTFPPGMYRPVVFTTHYKVSFQDLEDEDLS
jgi:hypothetical protein